MATIQTMTTGRRSVCSASSIPWIQPGTTRVVEIV
jgi:hypothetical protein